MPRGGKRAGAGRKDSVVGGRAWLRSIADDPARRLRVESAIDKAITKGELGPIFHAFEHGYGRPPQALDIKLGNADAEGFRCVFDDGTPIGHGLPATALPLPAGVAE